MRSSARRSRRLLPIFTICMLIIPRLCCRFAFFLGFTYWLQVREGLQVLSHASLDPVRILMDVDIETQFIRDLVGRYYRMSSKTYIYCK